MPKPGRGRGARSTRSPSIHLFDGFLIEAYSHPDDFPMLSDQPRRRPRHATRGATAAERRADLVAASLDRTPSPDLPLTQLPPHIPTDSSLTIPRIRSFARIRSSRCSICLRGGNKCMLLRCLECSRSVHSFCLNPPKTPDAVPSTWTCVICANAAAPRKRQGARAFRDALRKYSYLVPSRYLDVLAESVELAAVAESTTKSRFFDQEAISFAVSALTGAPQSPPDDDTVILKISAAESELEDITNVKHSLRHEPLPTKGLLSEREVIEHNVDNLIGTSTNGRLSESSTKSHVECDDNASIGVGVRARKRPRLSTSSLLHEGKIQASNSQDFSLHVPILEPTCDNEVTSRPRFSSLDSSRGVSSCLISKNTFTGRQGQMVSKNPNEVWVRLRCRPPIPEQEVALTGPNLQTKACPEENLMIEGANKVLEVAKAGNSGERNRSRFKERTKRLDADRKKGKSQTEIDSGNKAEVCRRLAKARAKKAELRKAAMHRKEVVLKSMVRESTVASSSVLSCPATPIKVANVFSQGDSSTKQGPSALFNTNIPSTPKELVPARADSKPITCEKGAHNDISAIGTFGNVVSTTEDKRMVKSESVFMHLDGLHPISERISPLRKGEERFCDLAECIGESNARGESNEVMDTSIFTALVQKNTSGANITERDAKADVSDRTAMSREANHVYSTGYDQTGGLVKNDPKESVKTSIVIGTNRDEIDLCERSGITNLELAQARSRSQECLQDGKIEQSSVNVAEGKGLEELGKRKVIPVIELDGDSEEDTRHITQQSLEQRNIATMFTPYQPIAKGSECSLRSVATKWGEMDLDAKNEALLTLAQEQKDGVKRRASSTNASGSLDKDLLGRNVKLPSRTVNVPESERKRMQVTALVTEGRARNTTAPTLHDSNKMNMQRGSLSCLLSDLPPFHPPGSVSRADNGTSQAGSTSQPINLQRRQHHIDHSPCVAGCTDVANITDAQQGILRKQNHVSHVPSVFDARAGGIQLNDTAHHNAGLLCRKVDHRETLVRDNVLVSHGNISTLASRPPPVNPSSRSGSQSEPGSSAALGLTSVYTLKKTRKRPTLADVSRGPIPPHLQSHLDANEYSPLIFKRSDGTYACNDDMQTPLGDNNQIYRSSGERTSMALGGEDQKFPMSDFPTQSQDGVANFLKTRQKAEIEEVSAGPLSQYRSYQHQAELEPLRFSSLDNSDAIDESNLAKSSDKRFSGPPTLNQYSDSPKVYKSWATRGGTQTCREISTFSHDNSRIPLQMLQSNASSFADSTYQNNSNRQAIDDHMMFTEPARRLRRSVAPTLPTAARRFQYEQGRQLAKFTPSTSLHDQPQAHSQTRRKTVFQRVSDTTLSTQSSDLEVHGDSHGGVQVTPLQSGFTRHGLGNNQVLSHEYISREGVRPQLAPVPPVVYEPEGTLRTRDLNTGSGEFPRLHDSHRSHAQSRQSLHGSSNNDIMLRDEMSDGEQPFVQSQILTQRYARSGSVIEQSRLLDESLKQQPRLLTISRAKGDGTGGTTGSAIYKQNPHPLRQPSPAALIPLPLPRGERVDDPSTAENMHNLQPTRTDPSLKNLLT